MPKLPSGPNPPEELYVIVEIPKGSNVKYELKIDSGLIMVDRILYTAMAYPYNYGSIPNTLMPDGEALDTLIIINEVLFPGTIIKVRPVGILEMEDERGIDHKLIVVPTSDVDPTFDKVKDLDDLPEFILNQIKHFFEHYKDLEPHKWSRVRRFLKANEAKKIILEAIERFKRGTS